MNRRTINEDQLAVVRLESALRAAEEELAAARRMTEAERDLALRLSALVSALDAKLARVRTALEIADNRAEQWETACVKAEAERAAARARIVQLETKLNSCWCDAHRGDA